MEYTPKPITPDMRKQDIGWIISAIKKEVIILDNRLTDISKETISKILKTKIPGKPESFYEELFVQVVAEMELQTEEK